MPKIVDSIIGHSVGDAENDLTLLENVGIGVAMGNVIDIVKGKSNEISLSNNEEGIYYYLTKKILKR